MELGALLLLSRRKHKNLYDYVCVNILSKRN